MYVYIQTEFTGQGGATAPLWTVGHYDPEGKWLSESDHDSREAAASRVAYLNGATKPAPAYPKGPDHPNWTPGVLARANANTAPYEVRRHDRNGTFAVFLGDERVSGWYGRGKTIDHARRLKARSQLEKQGAA
jgi:hypothetical protein